MVLHGPIINRIESCGYKKHKNMKKEEVENYLHQKIEKGETVSPILPEGTKNYLIDIDGTICDDVPNEEPERMVTAKLYPDALVTINNWFDKGHIICFFTARIEAHREVTEKWLKDNGFKYHSLLMGKPRGCLLYTSPSPRDQRGSRMPSWA